MVTNTVLVNFECTSFKLGALREDQLQCFIFTLVLVDKAFGLT